MCFPCGDEINWFGADESPTRTGSDAQTHYASVQFFWRDNTVRIKFEAYKDPAVGEWNVDSARWNNILDLVKKGLDIANAAVDLVNKGK